MAIRLNDSNFLAGARLLRDLPRYLRQPLTVEESAAILRRRMADREVGFLSLVRSAIYANRRSPYRELLARAGCEFEDLRQLVQQHGIEGALHVLYRAGVYLTVGEFKGREPVIRGSTSLTVRPDRFANPKALVALVSQSSGTRGPRQPVPIDLATIRERAVNTCLTLAARGGSDWLKAHWGVPGGSLVTILRFAGFGRPPVQWFWQVDPTASGLPASYRTSVRLLRWGSMLAGVALPRPRYAPIENPLRIARWMERVLRAGQTPHLHTFVSPAVRLCQKAGEAGVDLRGARFTVVGEPATPARLATMREAGVDVVPDYGSAESGGFIAYGCLDPAESDDLHFCHDLHAVIQPGVSAHDYPPAQALLISSLRPTAPVVLLNVSMGDQALIEARSCGCPLEELGWQTHVRTVRSFEKLTAGGVTLLDTDIIRVLEEVLPARFGGGPIDYQLLEEEADDGKPLLRLLVDPRVGPFQSGAVMEAFLTALSSGSATARIAVLQWRQANLLQVERRPPLAAATGKILHLHQEGIGSSRSLMHR